MKFLKLFIAIFTILVLSACGKGLDKKPDLSSTEAYRKAIDIDLAEAKPEEINAFNFAVSDLNFDQLKKKYPSTSYRDIARTELKNYITLLQNELDQANKLKLEFEKQKTELKKITIEVLGNELTHDTFFDTRDLKYEFRIKNGTSTPIAKVQLAAGFSINGNKDFLYQWNPIITFENGLRPGQSATFTGNMVGSLSHDGPITLEVREAKSREVRLMVTDLADFSEQWLIGSNSILDKLSTLQADVETTKKHLANLSKPEKS